MRDLSTGHGTVMLRSVYGFLGNDIEKDSWYERSYEKVRSERW